MMYNKNRNIVLITPDNYEGMEEWYTHYFSCPNCKVKSPISEYTKFCRGCGKQVAFTTNVLKYKDL